MNRDGVPPRRVLFLCGHNAVRSPMAAALARHLFGASLEVASAGVRADEPDYFAIAAMNEIGIDIARHKPVSLADRAEYDGLDFDLVISLSPEAHHAALELTHERRLEAEYWPTADPTLIEGSREVRMSAYRAIRDQLMERIGDRFGRR